MKKVLFIAGTSLSPFNTMLTIAKYIQKHSNEYEPLFILSTSQFEVKVKDLESAGIDYKRLYSNSSVSFVKKNESLLRKIYKNLQKTSLFLYLNSIRIYKQLVSNYKKIDDICKDMDIQAIFIPCDRCGGYENLFLKYAKENNIKSFVFPYAYTDPIMRHSKRKNKIELIFNKFYSPWINFFISKKFPKQVFEYDGVKCLFYPADYILATSKFDSLAINPWSIGGSGMIKYICVQGEEEKEKSKRWGVSNNLYITGHPEHDLLYDSIKNIEVIKNSLIEKFNLDKSKKIIVFSLPQWFENDILPKDIALNLQKKLISDIKKSRENLIISLHPKMDKSLYFSELKGENIIFDPLSSYLAIADIFIANSSSGTITWSLLLNIPSILLDEHDFIFKFYEENDCFIKCKDNELSRKIVEIRKEENMVSIKKNLSKLSSFYAKFDGNVNQRFLELIKE